MTGSFSDESNADARIKELKEKGYDSFKEIIQ
ncbi:SPOR domain-containing protein [Clostridium sp.]|nr:SPOR domain-containing protein [uncultured Clostridium sp.]